MSEDGWILIDDELPQKEANVLVASVGGEISCCRYGGRGLFSSPGPPTFTHWRPLPEPPKPSVSKRDQAILDAMREMLDQVIDLDWGDSQIRAEGPDYILRYSAWALATIKTILAEHEGHEESRPGDEMLPCPHCMDWVSDIFGNILAGRTMVYSKRVAVCPYCKRSPRAMAEAASDDWRKRVGRAVERSANG